MRLVRVLPPMIRPLVRAIYWLPLLVVTPVAPVLAALFRLGEDPLPVEAVLVILRACGLLLGTAAAFALVDGMAGSTAAAPVPRWLRQWLRSGLALGYAAAAWAATYPIIVAWSASPVPLAGITLEAAVCTVVGPAGAGFAVRRVPERHGASAGAATLFALVVGSLFLPGRWSPWPGVGSPDWPSVHTGWLLALPVALAALALAHRDTRSI